MGARYGQGCTILLAIIYESHHFASNYLWIISIPTNARLGHHLRKRNWTPDFKPLAIASHSKSCKRSTSQYSSPQGWSSMRAYQRLVASLFPELKADSVEKRIYSGHQSLHQVYDTSEATAKKCLDNINTSLLRICQVPQQSLALNRTRTNNRDHYDTKCTNNAQRCLGTVSEHQIWTKRVLIAKPSTESRAYIRTWAHKSNLGNKSHAKPSQAKPSKSQAKQ